MHHVSEFSSRRLLCKGLYVIVSRVPRYQTVTSLWRGNFMLNWTINRPVTGETFNHRFYLSILGLSIWLIQRILSFYYTRKMEWDIVSCAPEKIEWRGYGVQPKRYARDLPLSTAKQVLRTTLIHCTSLYIGTGIAQLKQRQGYELGDREIGTRYPGGERNCLLTRVTTLALLPTLAVVTMSMKPSLRMGGFIPPLSYSFSCWNV